MSRIKSSGMFTGLILLLSAYFLIQPSIGSCQDLKYPTRPIKLVVNYSAGGPTDVTCRALADLAGKYLGQEIIVENKAGAGGTVGVRFVAKSKPDGYTIGSLTASPVVTAPFFMEVDYNPAIDFTPIIQYAIADHPLFVPTNSPIKTFKDFIETARKREITMAGLGLTGPDISIMRLATVEKLKLKHVPYAGTSQVVVAVLGGHADAAAVSGIYEYVRGGKLRLLAQTGGYRNNEFPDIPTLKEIGYDIETIAFYGLIAPKALPEQIREKLEKAFSKAIQDPPFAQLVHNASYKLLEKNSNDFAKQIKEAYEKSEKELRELGLGKFAKEKK